MQLSVSITTPSSCLQKVFLPLAQALTDSMGVHMPWPVTHEHTRYGMQEAVIVTPFDRRLPRARLRTRRAAELIGQRFVVRLDAWPAGSQYPAAHLVSILGGLGDLQ